MRVLVVGKFPPIQGGVSAQTYRLVHGLAARGHFVDVVTNAREVEPRFRAHMRGSDWVKCGGESERSRVRIFWTGGDKPAQDHVPSHNPFATKLYAAGLTAAARNRPDAVFSFYLEPYAVAGDLLARDLGIPHIVRTAGSDIGRLRRDPGLGPAYDAILGRATMVWIARSAAAALVERGIVAAQRIEGRGEFGVEQGFFDAAGAKLDLDALRLEPEIDGCRRFQGQVRHDLAYVGMYGKLDPAKGVLDLLSAVAGARRRGAPIGLLLMGDGHPAAVEAVDRRIAELELEDIVVRLPFLPPWRVPEFVRRCVAVCCLEREFPVANHNPVIAREVLASGTCLVASTEMLKLLPRAERLVHGYNCIAIDDVRNADLLADRLLQLVSDESGHSRISARARDYAKEMRRGRIETDILEENLQQAIASKRTRAKPKGRTQRKEAVVHLVERVRNRAIHWSSKGKSPQPARDADWKDTFLAWAMARKRQSGKIRLLRDLVELIRLIDPLGSGQARSVSGSPDHFRLAPALWGEGDAAIFSGDMSDFSLTGTHTVVDLSHDAMDLLDMLSTGVWLKEPARQPSWFVAWQVTPDSRRQFFIVDRKSASLLRRLGSSGKSAPARQIRRNGNVRTILGLFERGLVRIGRSDPAPDRMPTRRAPIGEAGHAI